MDHVTFERINPGESRIRLDGDCAGFVYRQPDALDPGAHCYVVHLNEDWRGPVSVQDRARIREVTERLVDTHPLW